MSTSRLTGNSDQNNLLTIDDETKELIKKFRFRKETTIAAISFKCTEDQSVVTLSVDEHLEDISDLEEVQDELPDFFPRFVLLSYKITKKDGRVSYPLALVHYAPSGCSINYQMMYSTVIHEVLTACGCVNAPMLEAKEDLTDEWVTFELMKGKVA